MWCPGNRDATCYVCGPEGVVKDRRHPRLQDQEGRIADELRRTNLGESYGNSETKVKHLFVQGPLF
jgi:hypothetical protein